MDLIRPDINVRPCMSGAAVKITCSTVTRWLLSVFKRSAPLSSLVTLHHESRAPVMDGSPDLPHRQHISKHPLTMHLRLRI
jgi:hypothetical protein